MGQLFFSQCCLLWSAPFSCQKQELFWQPCPHKLWCCYSGLALLEFQFFCRCSGQGVWYHELFSLGVDDIWSHIFVSWTVGAKPSVDMYSRSVVSQLNSLFTQGRYGINALHTGMWGIMITYKILSRTGLNRLVSGLWPVSYGGPKLPFACNSNFSITTTFFQQQQLFFNNNNFSLTTVKTDTQE